MKWVELKKSIGDSHSKIYELISHTEIEQVCQLKN